MLKFFVYICTQLITPTLVLGMIYAFVPPAYGVKGRRILNVGVIVGVIAAIVMAIMKNTTSKIDTSMWNIYIYAATLLAFLLFVVLGNKKLYASGKDRVLVPVLTAIIAALYLFYALPDAFAYPYTVSVAGESFFSTDYLIKFSGYILGWLLMLLTFAAVRWVGCRVESGTVRVLLKLILLLFSVVEVVKGLQTLLARRIIISHELFVILKSLNNNSNWFIYGALAIAAAIPIILWVRSTKVNEPYENPAQHRKIRAKWRSIRRWSTTALCCFVAAVLTMTALTALTTRKVELVAVEAVDHTDSENLYVTFEQVADGHLHRFEYETPNGVTTRFIVIQKPNSSAYGIGLDACDICGETGYYERDGQVVCSLCDVVMNINTIGFKGGCNPIVIDYSIENGCIVVPMSTMIEHENEFKK